MLTTLQTVKIIVSSLTCKAGDMKADLNCFSVCTFDLKKIPFCTNYLIQEFIVSSKPFYHMKHEPFLFSQTQENHGLTYLDLTQMVKKS